jgi:hypothetical protein
MTPRGRISVACVIIAVFVFGAINSSAGANLPSDFTGIWIAEGDDNQCKKNDWREVAGSAIRLINITPRAIEMWESGCAIESVKNGKSSFQNRKSVEVDLSCGGEGMTWRRRDIWDIQNSERRNLLVITTVKTEQWRDDTRERVPAPDADDMSVGIYFQCK